MINKINSLLAHGQFRSALQMAVEAAAARPDNHLYFEKIAEALLLLGERAQAADALRNAIRLRKDLPYLRERLANVESMGTRGNPVRTAPLPKSAAAAERICGMYDRYPDLTGKRRFEGGLRLSGDFKSDMRDRPLVSIVTVVYNNPDSLGQCLESVFSQSYPNVECIVIDGGSSDPTIDVIRRFEKQIDYVVSEPDLGIYPAMNKGIRLARGRYICLLNSDDRYHADFIEKTVALAEENQSLVVFSDFYHGDNLISSRGINSGIFCCNLNLNHGAFLVNRRCYDLVGLYPESYKIMGDAVWMRSAFKAFVRFDHLPEPLMHFSAGGLSSGGSSSHRELFISEAVRGCRAEFGFISKEDAEEIYLLRFNPRRLRRVLEIAGKHPGKKRFIEALANYVEHCFRDRDNYLLPGNGSEELFVVYHRACVQLGVPLDAIRLPTKHGCFSEVISNINGILSHRKKSPVKTILHYAFVFSTPSETFIYDLLLRLESKTKFDNFILHDHRKLADSRPFGKSLWIPWSDFQESVRNVIYRHLIDSLKPDIIIGHFALNTWKITQRIESLGMSIPTLSMTHGIDVFMLGKEGEYRDFLLEKHARRADVRFTTVSRFLRDRLVEHGLPDDKIDLVHNSINPVFYANRRKGGRNPSASEFRLLSVGRLIDWKGHRHLVDAFSIAKGRTNHQMSLTIVYANGDDLLPELKEQINRLGLQGDIDFIPFVDFSADPEFFASHDLFVHPSTYSTEGLGRTETFGMAVLEAIAAGLPVIATDAGGVPEVIGKPCRFARIVPHGRPESMADAIIEAIQDAATFDDNTDYADGRLAKFSENQQIVSLSQAILRVTGRKIRATLFSSSTMYGAGYAAYRLHRGLLDSHTVSSTILTTVNRHTGCDGVRTIPHPTLQASGWTQIQQPGNSWPGLTIFTINQPIIPNKRLAQWVEEADIINLHWTARFLSVENIAWLTCSGKPVVMTLRDMFPITGGCHFFHGCEKWKKDCHNCPQLVDNTSGIAEKILSAKRRNYNFDNLTLVALSAHSASILREAPLFKDCRIEIIPNSIETDVFLPRGKQEAREHLDLPQDRKIIAYVPSFSSDVKGFKEARAALTELAAGMKGPPPLLLLVGRLNFGADDLPLEKRVLGYVDSNKELSYVYSAADVVLVPSLEETFSNTAAEAVACGTPVVGFKTGAIPELAIDGVTGYTFPVGDVSGLARGMADVLQGPSMSKECRAHAVDMLSFHLQSERYERLYNELFAMGGHGSRKAYPLSVETFPETTSIIAGLVGASNDE